MPFIMRTIEDKFWKIPPIWYGETVVILATGPSLTKEDCEYIERHRNSLRVIAVSDAYKLYPRADLLYSCDADWWVVHEGVPTFTKRKVSMEPVLDYKDVLFVKNDGVDGLGEAPGYIRNGRNSTYQAMGVAIQTGAKRIVFLGLDLGEDNGKTHFFGDHPKKINKKSDYGLFASKFKAVAKQIEDMGIEVINCSRKTSLGCFKQKPLEEIIGV